MSPLAKIRKGTKQPRNGEFLFDFVLVSLCPGQKFISTSYISFNYVSEKLFYVT